MTRFGIRLKELRQQNNLSQQELAEKIHVRKQTISQYERGLREPDSDLLLALCDVFNVSADYLLGKADVTARFLTSKELNALSGSRNGTASAVRIPVLGRVAAGIPIDAIEEIIDYEEITDDMAKTGEYFGLLIRGDSMEPKISNGDVVIVKKQDDADDGDLVIAIVNGNEGCCKRIKKYDDGTIAPVSTNPAYSPMFFTASEQTKTPVRIIGKVKELRAKF